jgi:hypothetical protein
MRCISAYLWELREIHKKIQIEPLTYDEQKEIIHAYNQVVNLCRIADTRGIEIFDMQRMKLNQNNYERILCEFAKHVVNNTKPGLFEEAAFSRLLTLLEPPVYEKLIYQMYFRGCVCCVQNNSERRVILCLNKILIYFFMLQKQECK